MILTLFDVICNLIQTFTLISSLEDIRIDWLRIRLRLACHLLLFSQNLDATCEAPMATFVEQTHVKNVFFSSFFFISLKITENINMPRRRSRVERSCSQFRMGIWFSPFPRFREHFPSRFFLLFPANKKLPPFHFSTCLFSFESLRLHMLQSEIHRKLVGWKNQGKKNHDSSLFLCSVMTTINQRVPRNNSLILELYNT